MGREPKIVVSVGKKGVGKTYQMDILIRQYVTGNAAKGVPPRRALILDVNDEYMNYRAISPRDITLFSVHPLVEARRIRPFHDNGKRMSLDEIADTLSYVLEHYRNGLLHIEDLNKFTSDNMPGDLVGSICTSRHSGLDISTALQSLSRITPKIWQNINTLRYHKCTDAVKRHKMKFEDKFEYLSIAENLINERYYAGDTRFFVTVDIDFEKIYGEFTEAEYEKAVDIYLRENYNKLVQPLVRAKGFNGKKAHTPETAVKEIKERLLKQYR